MFLIRKKVVLRYRWFRSVLHVLAYPSSNYIRATLNIEYYFVVMIVMIKSYSVVWLDREYPFQFFCQNKARVVIYTDGVDSNKLIVIISIMQTVLFMVKNTFIKMQGTFKNTGIWFIK